MPDKLESYLNLVPVRNATIKLAEEEGSPVLLVPMDSLFDFLAIRRHGKHRKLKLDDLGAFVWRLCDGEKTVRDIGEEVRNAYGDSAEPLYERLIYFLLELKKRHLLELK